MDFGFITRPPGLNHRGTETQSSDTEPSHTSQTRRHEDIATPPTAHGETADHADHADSPRGFNAWRDQRAPSAAAGGKYGNDGRLRPELTYFPPVGGDRQIAGCSAVNPRHCYIKVSICVHLRDLRFLALCGWAIFVPSCLRVCDGLCAFSVSLWFADSRFLGIA